ncbi:hypothetical protein [Rhodococcus artemisiae]|uniref:Uncharacterized protein n=1 Tax=Rhodococcus artemisiae TaxID=714159 RepID=A0ABU7LKV2_9NOCA|nr:hypothetical protein [Rhodococcus artemisiae]MEE2062193.1 hypothetical protein [Rhodococcus artemisiae]
MTATATDRRTGSTVRRAFAPATQRYRALLRRGHALADVPDYLRLFDWVDIAAVAARGVRLAVRDARGTTAQTVTLELCGGVDGEIVVRRVGAELFAAATILGEYLRLPATDGLLADMVAALGHDPGLARCTQVEQLMFVYRMLLSEPGSELENAL